MVVVVVVVVVRTKDNNRHTNKISNSENCGEVSSSSATSAQARLASPPWGGPSVQFCRYHRVEDLWCKMA